MVKTPKHKWGLGIRYLEQMNEALGATMVWRMVTGSNDLWKEVIRKKYIRNPKSKILNYPWEGKGTSIRILCKSPLNMIQSNFYWIPGNDKKIKIWTDRILGHPLSSVHDLEDTSKWDGDNGILTLFDLSTWDQNGNWKGWRMIHPPEH